MAIPTSQDDQGTDAAQKTPLRQVTLRTRFGKRMLCLPDMPHRTDPANSLILAFHGGHGSAAGFATRSGLVETLHGYGHDIAFPQAERHWADGRPSIESKWKSDRAFVNAMLDRQASVLDRRDVPLAVIGISNGGIFCQRLAAELPKPPAITVAVVSALTETLVERIPTGPPAPIMVIQATADPFIPWAGGDVPDVGGHTIPGRLLSADKTVDYWRRRNRISTAPRLKRGRISGQQAEIEYWAGGEDGADVWRVTLVGGGHRQLDEDRYTKQPGSLQDLICRTVLWYVDRDRLQSE